MSSRSELPGFAGVTVERDVPCVMRDGVTLYADVYRPAQDGPHPVILIRLPYDKTQAENIAYAHPAWYARRGYVVVSQDVRGRYRSEGDWYPFRHEAEDGYDTVEWAARLPDANGKVGMYGFSYGGATQLLAATERPPSLVTICPVMTGSQYYEGWTYNGGALALGFVASWALSLGGPDATRRGDAETARAYFGGFASSLALDWHLPLNDHPVLTKPDTRYFLDWLAHPTYDDFWRRWSIDEDYSRLTTPALHVAGWYDVFLTGTVKNFISLREESGTEEARNLQKLVIGPWYHIPWRSLGSLTGENATPGLVDEWQIAWFDQFLKGEETGVLEAPVTLYVLGEDRWRSFDNWPPSGSRPVPLYLHSGGRANSAFGDGLLSTAAPDSDEPADIFTYDPSSPNQSRGGHSCCFDFVAPMGPVDQSPSEHYNQVLVYTTEPLTNDLLLVGNVSAVLYAATSAIDTDWTARFCVVDENGLSINIQEGIVRARYRESLSAPSLLEPNRVYEYEIALGPVGIRVSAGQRLRVSISSSDFPQWDRNLNTGGTLGEESIVDAVIATQIVLHSERTPRASSFRS